MRKTVATITAALIAITMCLGCATVAIDHDKVFVHTVGDSKVVVAPCPGQVLAPGDKPELCPIVEGGTLSNNAAMVIPAVFGAIAASIVHCFVP